jgi:hypothetical protein
LYTFTPFRLIPPLPAGSSVHAQVFNLPT